MNPTRLERAYAAPPQRLWEMWTTTAGLEAFWGADGFRTRVSDLPLTPGGQVRYAMTATAPEQVAFLEKLGLPLTNEFRRTFTEIAAPTRLAYLSLIDFVPGQEPYEHLTTVDIERHDDGSRVIMTIDPLHDATWTRDYADHRANELENLARALGQDQ
jgi:uncharacterized protein YndB with AHSA1/START domain